MNANKFMTHRMSPTNLVVLISLLALSGCAHYAAKPLPDAADALSAPNPAILSMEAQRLQRPFLEPEPVNLNAPLTPNALAVIAVVENPDLKAQRAKLGVTDAQAFAARLLPDPTFQANFDKLLSGPDKFNGYGAQIGFDLNALRTRAVTRQSGEAQKRQVRFDLAWAEWNTSGQARLQGLRVYELERQLRLAELSVQSAENMFAIVSRAAGRGDLSATDLDVRRQTLIDVQSKLRQIQTSLVTAQTDLNKQLGLPPELKLVLAAPGSKSDTATGRSSGQPGDQSPARSSGSTGRLPVVRSRSSQGGPRTVP